MGIKIRNMWMTPFYISYGLLIVYILKSEINFEKIRAFSSIFQILLLLYQIMYAYVSITKHEKRTDVKGKNVEEKAKEYDEKEGKE